MLEAPARERIVFERSGHRPQFEGPSEFAALVGRVLDETRNRSRWAPQLERCGIRGMSQSRRPPGLRVWK